MNKILYLGVQTYKGFEISVRRITLGDKFFVEVQCKTLFSKQEKPRTFSSYKTALAAGRQHVRELIEAGSGT